MSKEYANPPMPEPEGLSTGLHLVWGSGSGPAQKVQIALNEKGLQYKGHMVSFDNGDTRRCEWIKRLNPRQQVPILIDNGHAVSQSFAILLYLEEKYPTTPPLLPPTSTLNLRTEVLTRAFEADDVFGRKTRDLFAAYFGASGTDESRKAAVEAYGPELDRWEEYLKLNATAHPGAATLVGKDVSLADIALYPFISTAVQRFGLDLESRSHLKRWYDLLVALPAFKASTPPHWANSPPKVQPFKGLKV
ncbi:hypothetical protein HK101_011466 [Irineochytrium annulatum]|nr:hypothetical protein HK101_011466 [Irineochytrium annulatum]